MSRTRLLLATTTVVLAAAAPASATTTLKYHGKTTKEKETKNGVKLTERLTDRKTGKRVGKVRVTIVADSNKGGHGTAKVILGNGTIHLSFDIRFSSNTTKGVVDGGTGHYDGATGTFKDVNTSDTEDNLTIRLD